MTLRHPGLKRTDTLFPNTTLFRSIRPVARRWGGGPLAKRVVEGQRRRAISPSVNASRCHLPMASPQGGSEPLLADTRPSGLRQPLDLGRARKAGAELGTEGAEMVRRAMRRSEEHTSDLQSLMRITYAVFCLQTKNTTR